MIHDKFNPEHVLHLFFFGRGKMSRSEIINNSNAKNEMTKQKSQSASFKGAHYLFRRDIWHVGAESGRALKTKKTKTKNNINKSFTFIFSLYVSYIK